MKKKSFLLYADAWRQIAPLGDEQAGRLLKALFRYVNAGDEPQGLDPVTAVIFSFLQAQLERDREKYEQICARRSVYGRRGAAVTNALRASATAADTVHETKKDNKTAPEDETQADFARFWEAYPLKSDVTAAQEAFAAALEQTTAQELLAAVAQQKKSQQWRSAGGQYIPSPANWLRRRRWLDRLPEAAEQPQGKFQAGFSRHDDALTPLERAAVERALAEGGEDAP